jgi:type II protein arginine methyltransferase
VGCDATRRPGPNTARTISAAVHGLGGMAVWLRLPLEAGGPVSAEDAAAAGGASTSGGSNSADPWLEWNALRGLCEASTRLGVILQLPAGPPSPSAPTALARWLGEPLKAAVLPAAAFTPNKRGLPALGKAHQALVASLFDAGAQLVLAGPPPPPGVFATPDSQGEASPSHWATPFWEYLAHLFRKPPLPDAEAAAEAGYRDYLQAPLQPLQDNLESGTYETFERDAPKYEAYEEAVRRVLEGRVEAWKKAGVGGAAAAAATQPPLPPSPPPPAPPTTVIMVVGAGRGPLVAASLAAADATGAPVRVYAVEKNPNAVITLQGRLATDPAWGVPPGAPPGSPPRVTLVAGDMRGWAPPERADVLVSELLGSFGDNELSPECLDGAQRLLKRAGEGGPGPGGVGVSIPAAYTSFLQPVSSAKLWADVKGYDDLEHAETPYVVKLHRFTPLADTRAVFTFAHPRPVRGGGGGDGGDGLMDEDGGADAADVSTAPSPSNTPDPRDNARYATLSFPRPAAPAALVHGLAGFFEADLGCGVTLSTHPPSHTPGMASWFPIFFPLATPLHAPAGADITVHVWRCVAPTKVWYEWAAEAGGVATHIHNPLGRSYHVGM